MSVKGPQDSDRPNILSRIAPTLRYIVIGLSSVLVLITAYLSLKHFLPFPHHDMYKVEAFLVDWLAESRNPLRFIEFLDNEHRPAIPMFVWAADHLWFKSTGLFPVVLSLVFNALILVLLLAPLRNLAKQGHELAIFGGVVILLLTFWSGHYANLVWAKQIHMYLCILSALAAFLCLAHARYGSSLAKPTYFFLSLILAWVSHFSFAYGVLLWPILFLYVLLWRWPWWSILSVLCLAGVAITLQSSDGRAGTDALSGLNVMEALSYLKFAVLFLAHPYRNIFDDHLPSGVAIETPWVLATGSIGLLLGSLLVLRYVYYAIRSPEQPHYSTAAETALLTVIFAVGISISTGFARMSQFGIMVALSGRYLIAATLFWSALIALLIHLQDKKRNLIHHSMFAVLILVFLGLVLSFPQQWKNLAKFSRDRQIVNIATTMRLDDNQFGVARFYLELSDKVYKYFEARDMSFYRQPWPDWIGRNIDTINEFALRENGSSDCVGEVLTNRPLNSGKAGAYLRGWAWDKANNRHFDAFVFTTAEGSVEGIAFASTYNSKQAKKLAFVKRSPFVFAGYSRVNSDALEDVYGLSEGGLCKIAMGTI